MQASLAFKQEQLSVPHHPLPFQAQFPSHMMTISETRASNSGGEMTRSMAKLLIVDDDERICRLIEKVADKMHIVSECVNEASNAHVFDVRGRTGLVLLDLNMPEVDGVEVLRRLAAAGCEAEVCLMSGTAKEVLESARRLGDELGLAMIEPASKPMELTILQGLLRPLQVATKSRNPTADELAVALECGEMDVHFQPKVSLSTGKTTGYEALARWHSSLLGDVPPSTFIPLAVEAGLMGELTRVVVQKSLASIEPWWGDASLCVNYSPVLFEDLEYPDRLEQWTRAAGIDPDRVMLEITESEAMRDPVRYIDILVRFRLKGFHLSIDDFGTGFSSMQHLYELPFEELKIDRSFISKLKDDADARVIVKAMVELARGLGLHSLAEGVEDAETAKILQAIGCQGVQGYHYTRALPVEALCAWETQRVKDPVEGVVQFPSDDLNRAGSN
ncbi:MAG TPA: EAL domain-containing response regulator [Planctomycetes bacterium]|nr:EAL domain-containing response regulator [Planctomycetota bacterium]HIK59756.1 EAL domain-containing response regulator [Planctomycetota bacterium]